MTPDARRLPEARIDHLPGAILVPMTSETTHACGVLDAAGHPVPAGRTLLSGGRFTPDPAAPSGALENLSGRWLFAGVGRHHFGHFLLEGTPRLWALDHETAPVDGIALIPMAGRDIAAVLRRRLGPLLDSLGQDLPVHLVEQPTRVQTLILPAQGYGHLHWSTGTPEARAYMRRHLCADVAPAGPERIYLSRRLLKSRIKAVPFEAQIEDWMRAAGFRIFHPERHPIREQIARYRAARVIVGPDGSAFHLAAMVMQPRTRVGLLQRRTRQPVFDAIARQIVTFGQADLWTSAALAQLHDAPHLPQPECALPPELHQLRADLAEGGFI
jgi:capsular polysaccharide biosynthesis protein